MKFTSFAPLGLLVSMTAAAPALTAEKIDALAALAARSADLAEDALAKRACSDVTIIFARGTTETGTIGTLVGPPFLSAVQSKVPSGMTVTMQGVPYPADIPGFLAGGDPTGSKTMASMVTSALAACPSTKLVMSGYSQGGQLVHNAASMLSTSTMSQVSSVVIFGDPDYPKPVANIAASRVMVICHTGDNICQGGDLVLPAHLTYGADAPTAAAFVVSQF